MNKTSVYALVVAGIAVVFSGFAVLFPANVKLGSYTPPVSSASGFSQSISTSTTLGAICVPVNIQFLGSSATVTSTFAAATSTFAACPSLNNNGASISGLFVNDSTNTVNFATATGDTFKCETQGVGTSTVSGTCTASAFSILASSTVAYTEFFDSGSSTLIVAVGNNFK